MGQYPSDYAQLFVSRWESIVRDPAGTVITLSRVSGSLGRLVDALPRRALLRLTSKVEHIAAGGEPAAFDRNRPAGRAWLDDHETQLFLPDAGPAAAPERAEPGLWTPRRRITGIITPAADATRSALSSLASVHRVVALEEQGPEEL